MTRRSSATSSRVSSRHSPGVEPIEVEARVAAPVESVDRMADGLAHPLHLALSALVERQLETPDGPRRRTFAGAVRPSSSSTPSASGAQRGGVGSPSTSTS